MIDITQFNKETEPELFEACVEFNILYQQERASIIELSYYELYLKTNKTLDILIWRAFYADMRVRKWYDLELKLLLDQKTIKIVQQAGENNSTATTTALSTLLKYKKDEEDVSVNNNKIFVYSFIPLTSVEEHLENVNIIKNIPKEIGDAITITERNKKS